MRNRRLAMLVILALPLPTIAALVAIRRAGLVDERNQTSASSLNPNRSEQQTGPAQNQVITTFTLTPAVIQGGKTSTINVVLRHPARQGGALVSLSASNTAIVSLPKNLTIPAGQQSAHLSINTKQVTSLVSLVINASYEGRAETDTLMLLPPVKTVWHVAPQGSSKGRGTRQAPWDLATALAGGPNRSEVKPGDTIWLAGGRYVGEFVSTLTGREDAPVIVRASPGERVTIDKGSVSEAKQPALKVRGSWVWFWGLEIMNSDLNRKRKSPYTGEDRPWRGSGADVYAPHVKFINMVFHDNGHGIWDKEDMTEIYGCLFFYNGNNKREHALYLGNASGTKYVTDNIIFAQGGYGLLAHSDTLKSAQKGLHIEGNTIFNNGALTLDDQTTGNLQVGGVRGVAAERIVLKNNYVYSPQGASASKSNGIRLGYEDTGNRDVRVLDNTIATRAALRIHWWQNVELAGNTIYSQSESVELLMPEGASTNPYRWDFNTYLAGRRGGPLFAKDSASYNLFRWQQSTGLDQHSRSVENDALRPSGVRAFIRPNRYEAGRAHITVFNWDRNEQVYMDVSSVLPVGARYEVLDAQNYFAEPVARGTYGGGPLLLPLKLERLAQPIGSVERSPLHTAPEFVVFVLRQVPAASAQK